MGRYRVIIRILFLWNLFFIFNTLFNIKEWFWGVILVLLLAIGCVELNPGPRSNEGVNRARNRQHYGSTDRRHGRHEGQERIPVSRFSVCWPFMFWCKTEPLPDEEGLLGRRPTRQRPGLQFRSDSEDDELLQVDSGPPDTKEKRQETEANLEVNLLKQQVEHLKIQLEREVKQRKEERKCYEDTIAENRQTQEQSRRLHEERYVKLAEEKRFVEVQFEHIRSEKEQIISEETNRTKVQLEQQKLLQTQINQIKYEKNQSVEDINTMYTELKVKLDQETQEKRSLEEQIEQLITEKEKSRYEAERICKEFQEKLVINMSEKEKLGQQVEALKQNNKLYNPEDQVGKLNKEFKRRKHLEKELEKQISEQKTLALHLQLETEKRQQLEQELRLKILDMESARREYDELNQEQEIQRRQLQHALEQEKIKHEEVSQQLDCEMKQKQELFRKLMKETEEKHKVELRLQQEIQARQEIELDLQTQILEQHESEDLLPPQADDNIEIISDSEDTLSVGENASVFEESDVASKDDDMFEEAEEAEHIDDHDDSNVNDDEEKQEIRQLLLEEFERLPTEAEKEKNSIADINLSESESAEITVDERFSTSLQQFFLDGINETNVIEVERHMSMNGSGIHEITETESPEFGSPDELNDVFEPSDIINRGNQYLTMTLIPEDELESPSSRRKGVLLKKSDTPQLDQGSDCVDAPRAPEDSKLIHFQYSDILEKIVTFQGKDVTLSSLLGETYCPQMELVLQHIRKLLKEGVKPVIGCSYPEEKGFSIPRKYFRKTHIKSEIFKHRSSRLPMAFAISGMTKPELEALIPSGERINQRDSSSGIDNAGWRFSLLPENSAEAEYKDLCKTARNFKAIHWLEKKDDNLMWKRSKGNIDVIRHYLDAEKIENISLAPSMEDGIIILSGNNGEGKTVCLRNFADDLKDADPSSWVIKVNANKLLNQTEKHNLTKDRVIQFLLSAAETRSNSLIDRLLLQYSLEIRGNVILLVDEINFRVRDKIQSLFDILQTMKIKKLVIAADKCVQEYLENALCTFATQLKPLDKQQLQELLAHAWKPRNDHINTGVYMKFAMLVLNSLISNFSLTQQHITMLAPVFEKELSEFIMSHTITLPTCLNIFEVYEKFLELQCELYCNASSSISRDDLKHKFYKELTYVAMFSVFSENQMKHIIHDFLKQFEDVKCEINKFSFLHRDLQDYVIAKWFSENYQHHTLMIEETYFEADYQPMWMTFDLLLAKGNKLHTAILNKDVEKLRNILSSINKSELNSLDLGGRSALHLASIQAKYKMENDCDGGIENAEIVSILLNYEIDISIRDSVLGWTALSYADRVGSWAIIEELLKAVSDVADMMFTNSKLGNTLFLQEMLTEAAVNGYIHVTAFMLDTGVDINMPLHSSRYSHQQYGLVHIASENCHIPLLEFLLDSGALVNNRNWDGSTPLHLASRQGKTESVKLLLQRQANVAQTNKNADTPLHEAVKGGHSEIVDILLKNHADVNCYNKQGETPFHIACRRNDLESVSYLLERNIDVNIRNKNGDSPIECAIWEGHTTLVKYVLGKCSQCLTVRSESKCHPLHLAAMKGDVLMLDYLLQVTPEIDVMTVGEDTPLHLASLHSKTDAAVFLLKKGANVNKTNNYGNTALHLSSLKANINVMKALLQYQSDVNACNKEGNTPLHFASCQGKESSVRCLISHGSDVHIKNREKNTSLQLAVEKGNLEVIKLLIEAGSDVNAIDRYGNTILHQTVHKRRADIIKTLTDTGQCNVNLVDAKGDSPLLTATRYGLIDIVKALLHSGVDVNFADEEGNTVLHIATVKQNIELMNLLIVSGANLNVKNFQGNTPLHRAVYLNNYDVIEFLVKCGALRNIQNRNGDTAFDIGVQLESSDNVLQIL